MKSTGNHPQKVLCSGRYGVESSTTSKDYGASMMTILGKTTEPQMPGSNQQLSYSDKWCSGPAWTPRPYRFNRFLAPPHQHTVISSELPKGFLKGSLGEEATTASVHSPAFKVQFSSVAQSCPALCGPMDCSIPGLPVHHQLPEFTQTRVLWVGDAIQPSHPLSSPSLLTFNLSQHQGLFKWVSSSH